MGYEFDFFQVGEASKPGDATCFRFGDLLNGGSQKICIIDAGTRATGLDMAQHIKSFYNTSVVDFAFVTHPHDDHIQGFFSLIESCTVKNLVMHLPWVHSEELHRILDDGRRTPESVRSSLQRSLASLYSLQELAATYSVTVYDYFNPLLPYLIPSEIKILGPSYEYYTSLLPEFLDTQAASTAATESLLGRVVSFFDFLMETLEEPADNDVSAMNNSSAILLVTIDGYRFLFTGDAGVPALDKAIDYAEQNAISVFQPNYFHIPHHGSKRNLGPMILDRICGEKQGIFISEEHCTNFALVSLAKEQNDKHPSKKVLNALRRRGYKTPIIDCVLRSSKNAPNRGWETCRYHPVYEDE
ncbi:hypothetical protein LJB81_03085 [Desulfovibrio sp. OttesenSCG-928-M14]|nr:hypothetical protein [Desulfovibrio sp. OttesenSCG-928-M14]